MADGDVTAGIRQAGEIGQGASQSPLDMVAKIVGIQNAQTQNKLYTQEIQNKITEQQQKQQEIGIARVGFMSGFLHAQAKLPMDQQTPDKYEDIFATARSLPGANGEAIDQLYKHFQTLQTPEQRQQWAFQTGAAMMPPEIRDKVYGQTVKTTIPGGQEQYEFLPGIGSPVPPQKIGGPIGGGMTADAGKQIIYVRMPDGNVQPSKVEDAPSLISRGGTQVTQYGQPVPPGSPGAVPTPGSAQPGAGPTLPAAPAVPTKGTVPNEERIKLSTQSIKDADEAMKTQSSKAYADRDASLNTIVNASPDTLKAMGKGNETYRNAIRIITALSPDAAKSLGIDQTATGVVEVGKAMARLIRESGGSETDARMFENMKGQPNEEMHGEALVKVAGYLKGLNLMDYVTAQEANQQAKHEPMTIEKTSYNQTYNNVQRGIDRNAVFHYAAGDKKGGDAYYDTLSDEGKAKYEATMKMIKRHYQPQSQGMR